MTEAIRVGMLGCGNVGAAVARHLDAHGEEVARRCGARVEVARVAVRRPDAERDVPLAAERFTSDPMSVVTDPDIDVVVELMGGVEPAGEAILAAIGARTPVVTANKELLATRGDEILDAAAAAGIPLLFEGAVGGGIPIVRPLLESLAGERITRIMGIVNGTTNYILTRMTEDRMSFSDALAEAQSLGYAERDPTDDVEGFDAAAKCAILASIAFDAAVVTGDVFREGIGGVRAEDIEFAGRLGHVIKLLAVAELEGDDVAARVHPAMIPAGHPLAAVRESNNAVFVEGEHVGELMFYGRGAGGAPTATAVVGDLVDVARGLGSGEPKAFLRLRVERRLRPIEEMHGQYYVCLDVADRPGVLAQVAGAFGANEVSIRSVWQEGTGEEALLVLITHRANEGAMRRTVEALRDLEAVWEVRSVMRVEGSE